MASASKHNSQEKSGWAVVMYLVGEFVLVPDRA